MGRPNKNEDEREEPLVAVLLADSFSKVCLPSSAVQVTCRHGQTAALHIKACVSLKFDSSTVTRPEFRWMMLWLCLSRTAFACQYACLQLHSNFVSFNQKACPHA
jgi:hypothetical protein